MALSTTPYQQQQMFNDKESLPQSLDLCGSQVALISVVDTIYFQANTDSGQLGEKLPLLYFVGHTAYIVQ